MTESIAIDGLTVMRALPQGRPRRNVLFVHGYFADAGVWEAWSAQRDRVVSLLNALI